MVSTNGVPAPLQLPPYVSQKLERSPLVLVAVQVNFEEVGDLTHGQARAVQKRLGSSWASLQVAPQMRFTFTPAGPVQENKNAYRLESVDGWSLMLNSDSVTLETQKYEGWQTMATVFKAVAETVATVFDPSQCLRLGMRFIDQVPMPDGQQDWRGLIRESVRGLVDDTTFGSAVLGSDQRQLLLLESDARCMFHHGLLADEGAEGPRKYLLDYDVFREIPMPFTVDDVTQTAEILHGYTGALFRASLEDDLYLWLKGVK